jgi:quercetin 2,3-dioxygenase
MIAIRPAEARGHSQHGWLDSRHTFSFAEYYDRRAMGFRSLRVINEDRVIGGAGFPTHSHKDAEIVSYVLEGALEHKDSLGTGSVIRPGDVQRMSAGTGVSHSEFNASKTEPVHFLQIWMLPARKGQPPSYEQKSFPLDQRRGVLRLVASPDAADGSLAIHQDVRLYAGLFDGDERATLPLAPGRHAWIQLARGAITVNGEPMTVGDGAALIDEPAVELTAGQAAEVLVFDLA